MTIVEFPTSGLTKKDCEALEREGAKRRIEGLPGYVVQGVGDSGARWAAILDRPGGLPLHHFSRDQGVYYLLDFSGGAPGRLVDAARDFREILKHLPSRPRRK